MKSLAELEAIRKRMLDNVNLRTNQEGYRVVVGAGTCGISAGARTVMTAVLDEISKRNLSDVTVTQMGCVGACQLEPVVDVFAPNGEKTTYVKMTAEKVAKVVEEHLVNGRVVTEYTIDAAQ